MCSLTDLELPNWVNLTTDQLQTYSSNLSTDKAQITFLEAKQDSTNMLNYIALIHTEKTGNCWAIYTHLNFETPKPVVPLMLNEEINAQIQNELTGINPCSELDVFYIFQKIMTEEEHLDKQELLDKEDELLKLNDYDTKTVDVQSIEKMDIENFDLDENEERIGSMEMPLINTWNELDPEFFPKIENMLGFHLSNSKVLKGFVKIKEAPMYVLAVQLEDQSQGVFGVEYKIQYKNNRFYALESEEINEVFSQKTFGNLTLLSSSAVSSLVTIANKFDENAVQNITKYPIGSWARINNEEFGILQVKFFL
jgi:hypothetical protein